MEAKKEMMRNTDSRIRKPKTKSGNDEKHRVENLEAKNTVDEEEEWEVVGLTFKCFSSSFVIHK